MKKWSHGRIGFAIVLLVIALSSPADDGRKESKAMEGCPMHAQHAGSAAAPDGSAVHGAEVDQRHDTFGMSHESTRHSFRIFNDGGAIELRANDVRDVRTIASIRDHLSEIATAFTKGDFSSPMFVHGSAPNGVDQMKRLQNVIDYRFEALAAGGRVRLTTVHPRALAAIGEFMKYQVIEHRTGDSGTMEADETKMMERSQRTDGR